MARVQKAPPPVPPPGSGRFVDMTWRLSSRAGATLGVPLRWAIFAGGRGLNTASDDREFLNSGSGIGGMADKHFAGQVCAGLTAPHVREWAGVGGIPLRWQQPQSSGFSDLEGWGVWRIIGVVAWASATASAQENGLFVGKSTNGGVIGTFSGNKGIMGVGLDSTGAPAWRSKGTDSVVGWDEETPLAWPGAVTDWVKVELQIRMAIAGRNASVRVLLNDRLALIREWGVDPLPNPDNDTYHATLLPAFIAQTGPILYVAGARYIVADDGPGA